MKIDKNLNKVFHKKEFSIAEKLFTLVNDSNKKITAKALKNGRQLCSGIKNKILGKYKSKGVFLPTDSYEKVKSGEAHIIHGNIFLIINRLRQQTADNHTFRIYAYLAISANDLLKRLDLFLKNKQFSSEVQVYLKDFDNFKQSFNEAWEASRKV